MDDGCSPTAVSYTHLTLPTNREVVFSLDAFWLKNKKIVTALDEEDYQNIVI